MQPATLLHIAVGLALLLAAWLAPAPDRAAPPSLRSP